MQSAHEKPFCATDIKIGSGLWETTAQKRRGLLKYAGKLGPCITLVPITFQAMLKVVLVVPSSRNRNDWAEPVDACAPLQALPFVWLGVLEQLQQSFPGQRSYRLE